MDDEYIRKINMIFNFARIRDFSLIKIHKLDEYTYYTFKINGLLLFSSFFKEDIRIYEVDIKNKTVEIGFENDFFNLERSAYE